MTQKVDNGILRDMTSAEQLEYDNRIAEENAKLSQYKLEKIRELRNNKLIETDYLAMSDNTMPDNIKTWRQSLRDLPQNNTTEEQYDALLARDSDGNLTNSIWSKP
jgi:hypothetical protein